MKVIRFFSMLFILVTIVSENISAAVNSTNVTYNTQLTWQKLAQPFGTSGGGLGSVVQGDAQNLYMIAANSGVYKSSDQAQHWQLLSNQGFKSLVGLNQLVYFEGKLYAADSYGNVYRYDNVNHVWQIVLSAGAAKEPGIIKLYVANNSLYVFQRSDSLYDATLYSAVDGAHWNKVNLADSNNTVDVVIANSGNMYLLTSDSFYKSTDFAKSWSKITTNLPNIDISADNHLFVTTTPSGEILYFSVTETAGVDPSFYRSSDQGQHWANITEAANSPIVYQVFQFGSTVYVATFSQGIISSQDEGITWQQVSADFSSSMITNLSSAKDKLFAGTSTNLFMLNSDNTWSEADNGVNDVSLPWLVNYPDGSLLAASQYDIFKSTDNGLTWQRSHQGMKIDENGISGLAKDNLTQKTYITWLREFTIDLIFSTDEGNSWAKYPIGYEPIFIASSNGILYFGTGGSVTPPTSNLCSVTQGVICYRTPYVINKLYGFNGDAYVFANYPNRLLKVSSLTPYIDVNLIGDLDNKVGIKTYKLLQLIVINSTQQEILYALTDRGLFTSRYNPSDSNSKVSIMWSNITPIVASQRLNDLTSIMLSGELIYVTSISQGVLRSADQGRSWQSLGLQNNVVLTTLINEGELFATTSKGTYKAVLK